MHLAEILASTEEDAAPMSGASGPADVRRHAAVPRGAREAASRTRSCAPTCAAPPTPSATSAPRAVAELRRLGAAARGRARRSRTRSCAHLTATCVQLEESVDRGGRHRPLGRATPTRPTGSSPSWCGPPARGEVVKVKSMATQEIGLNEALAGRGHRRVRDRPGRAHRPARPRPAVAHPGAGHPPQPRRDPRHLRGEMGDCGRPAPADLTDDPRDARRGRPPPPAREVPARQGRRSRGANFAVAETGTLVVVESEGNGRMCLTLPETLITVVGIEKLRADAGATWRSSCSCCRAPRRPSG